MDLRNDAARHWLVTTALAYLGTPYRWGGDDPSGFDCSGLVIESLRSVGLLENVDLTADGLMKRFLPYQTPEPDCGRLVFLIGAEGRAVHVGICLDKWFMIEAGGGDGEVVDRDAAWRRNAFVKIRPLPSPGPRRKICDPFMSTKE